eukprot:924963-Amphidinium_carterae.1
MIRVRTMFCCSLLPKLSGAALGHTTWDPQRFDHHMSSRPLLGVTAIVSGLAIKGGLLAQLFE